MGIEDIIIEYDWKMNFMCEEGYYERTDDGKHFSDFNDGTFAGGILFYADSPAEKEGEKAAGDDRCAACR